ncbi:MAG: alpha/beta hydrolase [Candidatus Nanopelagicales bacterium]|nr:alpha/beta hydrolase [Candidatus Nanopelagicales bacterium]
MKRLTAKIAVLVLAPAVAVAACVSAPYPEQPPDPSSSAIPLSAYYDQDLDWQSCGGEFECARLSVPKDYEDASAGDFQIDIVRLPSTGDQRQGSLVVNPGGPGGSGVEYARAAAHSVSGQVRQSYDIVGFDPRGVGGSDPVDCVTDSELDSFIAADGAPSNPQEAEDLAEMAKEFGRDCAATSPDSYKYMGTDSVARDLDILRAVLGDDKLNYLGKSYGTLIGETYLKLFADKVRRMVLDGVLPPDLTSEQVHLDQAVGFEQELRRFVRYCQRRLSCPLPKGSVNKGVASIQRFLKDLRANPIKAERDRPLTESLAAGAILYYLYAPFYGDWDELSAGLAPAFRGDGSKLMKMLDRRLDRSSDGQYQDNSIEAFYAVTCLDRAAESDLAVLAKREKEWAKIAPTFGASVAWSDLVCGQWPTPPTGKPFKVDGAGAGPILVVSPTRDPATPLKWARRVVSQLTDGHLITWNADGHTAYMNGSACVDRAVNDYLLTGRGPKNDPRCE